MHKSYNYMINMNNIDKRFKNHNKKLNLKKKKML